MLKIPIKKLRKKSLVKKISDELRVDLRNNQSEPIQKQPSRKGLFLIVLGGLSIIIILFYAVSFFFFKGDFDKIIPQERVIFSLIDQRSLYSQILPFKDNLSQIDEFFIQIGLDFEKDIQPLFKKQAGFALLPSDLEVSFPFVLILKKNESKNEIKEVLGKLETGLKENCNYSSKTYRQTEMGFIQPVQSLSSLTQSFVYALIEDYLIISNSQETVEKSIDKIIDK